MKNRFADFVTRRGFVASVGTLTGAGLASVAVTQTAAAQPADAVAAKIGVIDFQGAIAGTAEGKQAAAQIQSQFAPRQNELSNISKQINDLQTKLTAGQNTLSDDEKAHMQNQINQLQQSGQRKLQDLNDDQAAAEQDLVQAIGAKMVDVVEKYAKDNGLTLILDGGAQGSIVVYAADSTNITQPIVTLYDSTNPAKAAGTSSVAPHSTPSTHSGTGTAPKPQQ
jgi:outer membrane protein